MNKERILALADLIELQPHKPSGEDSGFNMNAFAHTCGTPSCIAGWATWEALGRPETIKGSEGYVTGTASSYLGLSVDISDELFYPGLMGDASYEEITPAEAAYTLRRLVETGEVDWSEV